jgi:hypothetical protein
MARIRSGEVFAIGMAHSQHGDALGAVTISILYGGGSEGLTCFAGGGQFVFPSMVAASGLAGIEVAGAVAGESGTLGRVALAPVHLEHRGRDVTVVGEPFQLRG